MTCPTFTAHTYTAALTLHHAPTTTDGAQSGDPLLHARATRHAMLTGRVLHACDTSPEPSDSMRERRVDVLVETHKHVHVRARGRESLSIANGLEPENGRHMVALVASWRVRPYVDHSQAPSRSQLTRDAPHACTWDVRK